MRKIYMVDLGLLVAAGTLAIVLTAKPVSSDPKDTQEEAAPIAVSEAGSATPAAQGFSVEWTSYEEDDLGSQ